MSYSQEIYDAARSRIGSCDPDSAMRDALRDAFGHAGHLMQCVAQEASSYAADAAAAMMRPAVLFRPAISLDGNEWCALYGNNLQEGVAGFGKSPELAMAAFDLAWGSRLEATA